MYRGEYKDKGWSEMDKIRLAGIKKQYESVLLDDVVSFWEKNGIDTQYGGYIHYLDRDGSVLCDDKAVWIQSRACWLFARLYNTLEPRDGWLEKSRQGYEFIRKNCFDERGRMYFKVTREGKPLQMRRYFFSEAFTAIAFAEYGKAARNADAVRFARDLFIRMTEYLNCPDPAILPPKIDPVTRPLISHSPYMIMVATAQILRECDDNNDIYQPVIDDCIRTILEKFVKPEQGVLLETVKPDGAVMDNPEGRTVNPGHAIETAWFIMQEGLRSNRSGIISQSLNILKWSFERGWDKEYGGLLNFVDLNGKPPEKIEWSMKYWWPHNEALYASLLAYHITKDESYAKMFEKVHAFSFEFFPDPEYGEWYGYLNRDGSVCLPIKGSMFKGPFHLPRQLLYSIKLIDQMLIKE